MPRAGARADARGGGAPCGEAWTPAAMARVDAVANAGADGTVRDSGERTAGTDESLARTAPPDPPAPAAGPWRYIVTDGPQGPVVTRAPAD
jgi:hypothetical protein